MELPRVEALGLLLIPDPHVAATPPGQRLEGYCGQILDKLRLCLEKARELELVPVFLGDLFHWPRENPNSLLVELIELLRPHKPFTLVGNHDKYQARFTRDVSMAVLDAAGAIRLLAEPGPAFWLHTPQGAVLVGCSPDGSPLPRRVERGEAQAVVWLTHHSISFPDFLDRMIIPREIPGVDWVLNGHIHRPQPMIAAGSTRYANPGNITRLTFSQRTKERVLAASIWRPGCEELERWLVPCLPFEQVFPDQPFPVEPPASERASLFLKGLERLTWRRTQEGLGLKDFLSANLNPEHPEADLVWQLYEEVAGGQRDAS